MNDGSRSERYAAFSARNGAEKGSPHRSIRQAPPSRGRPLAPGVLLIFCAYSRRYRHRGLRGILNLGVDISAQIADGSQLIGASIRRARISSARAPRRIPALVTLHDGNGHRAKQPANHRELRLLCRRAASASWPIEIRRLYTFLRMVGFRVGAELVARTSDCVHRRSPPRQRAYCRSSRLQRSPGLSPAPAPASAG
jgi:hypothetical protein